MTTDRLVADLAASIGLLMKQLEPASGSDDEKALLQKMVTFEKLEQAIARQIAHAKKKAGGSR